MEAASKKRGRPRVHDISEAAIQFLAPRVKTPRHKQNRWLAQQAMGCLLVDGKWVPGIERLIGDYKFRVGVFEQLGRMRHETGCDDEAVIDHARECSKLFVDDPKMTTRKAVQIMQLVRAEYRENIRASNAQ